MNVPFVEATLTFIPPGEGGRSQLKMKLTRLAYRPHIVIWNPAQREAIVGQGNVLLETYLGVAFAMGPEYIEPDVPCHGHMMLYWPAVNYNSVVPGATFTLLEEGRVVGLGEVTKRWVESATTIAQP